MPSSVTILSQKGRNCALKWVTSVLDIVNKVLFSVTNCSIFWENTPFSDLKLLFFLHTSRESFKMLSRKEGLTQT